MTKSKLIAWEKWKNPYRRFKRKPLDDYEDGYDSDVDLSIEDEDDDSPSPSLLMFTPIGPVPLTDNNDPEKLFNFWIGHANFEITPSIKQIIRKAAGVEICNIYTRYRFRIGIGKMFVTNRVTKDIEEAIKKHLQKNEPETSKPDNPTGQVGESCNERDVPAQPYQRR